MFSFFDLLFPPRDDEILLRPLSRDALHAFVQLKRAMCTRPGSIVLLPFHESVVRAALHEAKYHGSRHAFRLLGAALSHALSELCPSLHPNTVIRIIPVPLGRDRRKRRGFNQVEEVIREALSTLLHTSVSLDTTLLVRSRETVTQITLPREKREQNMRGAFGAAHSADPAATYILIDDVLTTGATLQAAIDALRQAGAREIIPLALAH